MRWLRIRATRFTTFPHRRLRCLATVGAGSAAAWKYGKPLVQGIGGLADSKYCYKGGGGRADTGSVRGAGVVRLGKRKLGWRGWQGGGCGFGVAAGMGLALGNGSASSILAGFGSRDQMGP